MVYGLFADRAARSLMWRSQQLIRACERLQTILFSEKGRFNYGIPFGDDSMAGFLIPKIIQP